MIGLTRKQILDKMPELPSGSFELLMARAGIKRIGEVATKREHIKAYIYPLDSVNKLREAMK